jgi:hypothetical protein
MQRVSVTGLNSKEQEGIENWTSGKGTMEGRKLRWPCKKSRIWNPATSRKNPHWIYSPWESTLVPCATSPTSTWEFMRIE